MKIVPAPWERRNLGVEAVEVEIEAGDSLGEFNDCLDEINSFEYICLKCATNEPSFLVELPKRGFTFIETQVGLKYECKNKTVFPQSEDLRRMYSDRIDFREIEGEAFERLLRKVQVDEMFKTDRIYLDRFFPSSAADKRYAGWCRDLKRAGSTFLEYLIDGVPVGFYEYQKKTSKSWHTSLGGMYPDRNEYALLTPAINCVLLDRFEQEGMRTMRSAVSTNNAVILRLHLSVGYQIGDVSYVYVKHNR